MRSAAQSLREVTPVQALRKWVQIQDGGRVELQSSELTAGQWAEVIVLADRQPASDPSLGERWAQLFGAVRSSPGAPDIDEQAIAEEIAAFRAER